MDFFFKLMRPDDLFERFRAFGPSGEETTPLEAALGRVVSREILSPEDLPSFYRSSVDGYAIKAKDSFGATESLPALVEVVGEVSMGKAPSLVVGEGQAAKISTGGMLPEGADSVEMVEFSSPLDENTIEISRAVSPLENVIEPGDDVSEGEVLFRPGHRLGPQDLGLLAGLGIEKTPVYRKPRVAIISTGDEIVPSGSGRLGQGQVRDINRYTLGAFCERVGAVPLYLGLCPDEFGPLKRMVETGLREADAVWISGGSSVGARDLTLSVFESLMDFELLAHGVAISPGKPTIIGRSASRPLVGLPGHAASALVVARILMTPLLHRLSGQTASGHCCQVEARLTRNVESVNGREDYIRIKLIQKDGETLADPVFGKSGLISTLVNSDGLLKVDLNKEGLYQGQNVKVMVFDRCGGSGS